MFEGPAFALLCGMVGGIVVLIAIGIGVRLRDRSERRTEAAERRRREAGLAAARDYHFRFCCVRPLTPAMLISDAEVFADYVCYGIVPEAAP